MAKAQQVARMQVNGGTIRVVRKGNATTFQPLNAGWLMVPDMDGLLKGLSAKDARTAGFWAAAALNAWAGVVNRHFTGKDGLRLTNVKSGARFMELQAQLVAIGQLDEADELKVNELPIAKLA